MFGPVILQYFITLEAIDAGSYVTLDLRTGKLRNAYGGEPLIGHTIDLLPANTIVGLTDMGHFVVIPRSGDSDAAT